MPADVPEENVIENKVKGSVIIGYFKFIKKTWGNEGLDDSASALNFGPDKLDEGKWYNDRYSVNVLTWIAENKGEEYLERCGNYTVKDLGLLSYIVRFMDIKAILKRGPDSYREAFNYGTFKVEIIDDNRATIKIKGSAANDKYACKTWTGVFKGMLEMTKTKGRVLETQCELKGGPYCLYEMSWE